MLFLIMAVAAVFYVCFSYVQTQNQLHEQRQQVVAIQSDIAQMKEDNEQEYQTVVDSVDLADVYHRNLAWFAPKRIRYIPIRTKRVIW